MSNKYLQEKNPSWLRRFYLSPSTTKADICQPSKLKMLLKFPSKPHGVS